MPEEIINITIEDSNEAVNITVDETTEQVNITISDGQVTNTSELINDGEDGVHPFITLEDIPASAVESVTGDLVDNTDPANPIINNPTLAEVLSEGNLTGGENIVINDADAIQLENASTLKKGTYDFGAAGGISRICGVGYEDMWQSGFRHVFDSNGLIRNTTNGFNIVPDSSFDVTLRFKIDSFWTLDNGDTYKCTDATEGAAVWELVNTGTTPTLQQVTDAGNETSNPIKVIDTGNNSTQLQQNGLFFEDLDDLGNTYILFDQTSVANQEVLVRGLSGTMALLSDIPAAGVTSVGLTMPSAFTVTNSPITSSGDIAVTGAGLVSQYVRGDGTLANFPNSTGGGSSVNYYLNGSVSQGTFGGDIYYEMSKTPILGAGTNFTRTNGQGNGYIASFITDAGDPSFLNIPGGNWNLEFYLQSSSTGGSPQFYGEIYKVSATNVFTLVASGVSNPEGITNGTTVDQYFTSIPVPQTSLLITDRLAIRIYVITSGRTITLHTENGNLSEVLTTFTTGLTALNGLTQQVQNLAVGTSGTDFAISSATDTHTFNLPTASATNRGALSSADWSTFNSKQNALSYTPYRFTAPSQIVHTGVLTETILQTILIPANTFSNGDFIMFSALVSKLANIGSTTHQLKINTTNTLVGSSLMAIFGLNTVNFFGKFKREFVVNGGNIYGYTNQVSTANDQTINATTNLVNIATYNLSNDLYFFVTCQLSNILDTITYRGINFYKQ